MGIDQQAIDWQAIDRHGSMAVNTHASQSP